MSLNDSLKKIGSQKKVAAMLGVTPQAVCKWLKLNRIPAEKAVLIQAKTNGEITIRDLRPDLYAKED